MTLALNLTAKIGILMMIGFWGKKAGLLDEVCKEKLSNLLVNLLLPINMIVSSQQAFQMNQLMGAGEVALIAFFYYIIALVFANILGRRMGYEQKKRAIVTLLIVFANTGFLGMPFLAQILGDTGILYGAVYNCVFDLLYFSYGIYIISGKESKEAGKINLLNNPLIWIAVVTMIIYVLPWRAPEVVTDTLSCLGDTMMPISMLIIGAEIAEIDFKSIITDKSAYAVSLIRMIFNPTVTFLLMKWIGVRFEVAVTVVILSAMPSGSLNVVMAQKYKNNPEFAAVAIMQNTILMMVVLPIFTYLCETCL